MPLAKEEKWQKSEFAGKCKNRPGKTLSTPLSDLEGEDGSRTEEIHEEGCCCVIHLDPLNVSDFTSSRRKHGRQCLVLYRWEMELRVLQEAGIFEKPHLHELVTQKIS
ncbi:Calpain-11 [Manis pentadactyla]|nr:Calpain-11 [Manis pentadactyla]